MEKKLVLASASPRREELLRQLGLSFEIIPSEVEERIKEKEEPRDYALRIAEAKAREIGNRLRNRWILGADTIVLLNGEILGKPEGKEKSREMLLKLSNREHTVITAFCLLNLSRGREEKRIVESKVKFKNLSEEEIESYIASGEHLDKAGGYGIQGLGSSLVEEVQGSYSNVVGLPLEELREALKKVGIYPER